MTIKEQAEMQTPDAPSTELQNQTQMNKVYVAPEAQNYATSGKVTQAGYQNADTTRRLQNWDAETTRNKMNNTNQSNTQVTTPTEISNVNNQTVQPIQNQSNIAVKIPSDLYDQTVQGYLNEYNKGKEINDYQAQINALNAIDQYRTSQGYAPIYTSNVYELMNQRTEKIKNAIREYETDMASATYSGDEVLAQQIGQQMEAYKRSVNYQETLDNASNYLANIEYKSVYDTTINDIVNELLTSRFTYDPSDDKALLKAQKYATNTVYESMNAKGILDSTMTAQMVTNAVNELIPVYEKMAKEEFYNNIERLQSMANLVINLDDRQYQRWQDSVQNKLDYYSAKKDEINYQWDRVNKLGYVDNEASIVLGVAPGTMSPSMREKIQKAEQEAQSQYNKLLSDIKLAEVKAQLDQNTYAYKKKVDAKYSSGAFLNIGGTKYNGTNTNNKNAIAKAYETKTKTASETLLDAVTNSVDKNGNIKDSNVTAIVEAVFKDKGDKADTSYTKTLKNLEEALITETISLFGEINNETKDDALKWIADLYENGYFNFTGGDTVTNNLIDRIEAGIAENGEDLKTYQDYEKNYNAKLKSYMEQEEKVLEFVTNFKNDRALKRALKQRELPSQLKYVYDIEETLIEQMGETNYNLLVEKLKEKESEISQILEEKGIDW